MWNLIVDIILKTILVLFGLFFVFMAIVLLSDQSGADS